MQHENDTLELSRTFAAAVEDVFDAWTLPEMMKRWMYSGQSNDIMQVVVNLEPNGEFCILKHDPVQELVDYCGHYNELACPHLLSFSLESPLRFTGISRVVIRFSSVEEGCRMDFLQTGIDPSLVKTHWEKMFDNLVSFLEAGSPATS